MTSSLVRLNIKPTFRLLTTLQIEPKRMSNRMEFPIPLYSILLNQRDNMKLRAALVDGPYSFNKNIHISTQRYLLTSGVQQWNQQIISLNCDNTLFCFCSTIAIYIYSIKDFNLRQTISICNKSITCVQFSHHIPHLIFLSSLDGTIYKLNLKNTAVEHRIDCGIKAFPIYINLSPVDRDIFAFILYPGITYLYNNITGKREKIASKYENCCILTFNQSSSIPLFAIGTLSGNVIIYNIQKRSTAYIALSDLSIEKEPEKDRKKNKDEYRVVALLYHYLHNENQYLLAGLENGDIYLIDPINNTVIIAFQKIRHKLSSLCWQYAYMGNFFAISSQSSVVYLYHISHNQPLRTINFNYIHCGYLHIIPLSPPSPSSYHYLLTLTNGSVMVIDDRIEKKIFQTLCGHSETIFDCRVNHNGNLLATVSYDNYIKIWDIGTMSLQKDIYRNDREEKGFYYAVAFHPNPSDNRIAVVTNKGYLLIYDISTSRLLLSSKPHNSASYRVVFHQSSDLIASSGNDGYAVLSHLKDLHIVHRFQHQNEVIGLDFNPFYNFLLLTGCMDGIVRLFDILVFKEIAKFKGHKARVFNVQWHPFISSIFCSGSDDHTIMIWDTNQPAPQCILTGHSQRVRALSWHNEIPNLLLSGSWDSSIRIWDIATQSCINGNYNHYADVYGLSSSPIRPNIFISSSRDSTCRVFALTLHPLSTIYLSSIINKHIPHCSEEEAKSLQSFTSIPSISSLSKLYGTYSLNINNIILKEKKHIAYHHIYSFFDYRQGEKDFWNLVNRIINNNNQNINKDHSTQFCSVHDILKISQDKCVSLLNTASFIGSLTQNEREEIVLDLYLKMGHMRQYCELLFSRGQQKEAIIFSPSVSLEYWRELCERYCSTLPVHDKVPFLAALGHTSTLMNCFQESQDYFSSLLVHISSSQSYSILSKSISDSESKSKLNDSPPLNLNEIYVSIERLSLYYNTQSKTLQAASAYLMIHDARSCFEVLLKNHQIELAYMIADIFNLHEIIVLYPIISSIFESYGDYDNAINCLKKVDKPQHLYYLVTRYIQTHTDFQMQQEFIKKAGIMPPEELKENLNKMIDNPDNFIICCGYCAVLQDYEQLVQLTLVPLRNLLASGYFDLTSYEYFLFPWLNMNLSFLDIKLRDEILSYTYYLAIMKAGFKQYYIIIRLLFQCLYEVIERSTLQFPLPFSLLKLTELNYMAFIDREYVLANIQPLSDDPSYQSPLSIQVASENLSKRLYTDYYYSFQKHYQATSHYIYYDSSNLPSGNRNKRSLANQKIINGPLVVLEDRLSCLSINEYLMWRSVCPFSPLSTGQYIFQYHD